ncbi:MAG: UDP-3-O-(3-hydroxymyristoyl)glucosamine N-acyltransferase [Pseudomonadota bacterium]
MADPRFFTSAGPFTLAQIAEIGAGEIGPGGDPELVLEDVAPLDGAGPRDLSFLDNKRYVEDFRQSAAGACIVDPDYAAQAPEGMALVLCKQPYMAYAKVAQAFYPAVTASAKQDVTAVIHETAKIGEQVSIGPNVVVGARASIGRGCSIGPNSVVGDAVEVGDGTVIGANVTLSHCLIGNNCQIHPGVRIGTRGFGFAMDPRGHVDVPQLGRVILEDYVEVGANSTIDRGAGPDTVVGQGSKIDNLVQIGHNVQIGRGCVLVAQSGIAGSTVLGDHVAVAAQAGVAGHLTLGTGSKIGAASGVMRDVPAGQSVAGAPAIPVREFFRLVAHWQRQIRAKG